MGRTINGFKTNEPLSYQLRMDYDGQAWCGATLISSKYAITAYHCVVRYHLPICNSLKYQKSGQF